DEGSVRSKDPKDCKDDRDEEGRGSPAVGGILHVLAVPARPCLSVPRASVHGPALHEAARQASKLSRRLGSRPDRFFLVPGGRVSIPAVFLCSRVSGSLSRSPGSPSEAPGFDPGRPDRDPGRRVSIPRSRVFIRSAGIGWGAGILLPERASCFV